ncbi:hypothetical protein BMETH_532_2 [methanotrophic bacterial endosymbiont of Bathymodiolus sp.]|nr:hypothetical protein BMETH_532_2 [methanotrophic bacterial endosymbiont of Bathymodiolus sp.]
MFILIPKRIRNTFDSRAVNPANTPCVDSFKPSIVADSTGESIFESSIKSPKCESSSSPIGVSMEIGSLAIFSTFRTLSSCAYDRND